MALIRKHDWQSQFHKFLDARAAQPFAWGSNDCCLFTADAIEAITGTDLAADFRGKYTDQASAMAAIKTIAGGSTPEDAAVYVAKQHQLIELPSAKFAQRGDMVVLDSDGGTAVGIVYLNGLDSIFVGPDGLRRVKTAQCRRAWRIG